MEYSHEITQRNGDATCNYKINGTFPVKFSDFLFSILENTNSFRVEFLIESKERDDWFSNTLELYQEKDGKNWKWTEQNKNQFNEISNKMIDHCWANGGWGQMLYFCTLKEE